MSFHSAPWPRLRALGDEQVLAHRGMPRTARCAGTCGRSRGGRGGATGRRLTSTPVELDGAAVDALAMPEQAVEERRLAGAVRADEPDPLALVDVDATSSSGVMPANVFVTPLAPAGTDACSPVDLAVATPGPSAAASAPDGSPPAAHDRSIAARSPPALAVTRACPSGCRANWSAPRPNSTNAPASVTSGKTHGMRSGLRSTQPKIAPFSRTASNSANADAGLHRALDRARSERHHQHQPEQALRTETKSVA